METITKEQKRTNVNFCKYFKVLLHNDKVNDFEYVKDKVKQVFRMEEGKAKKIVLEAHSKDFSIVVVEPFEHAELHNEQLSTFKIKSSIEPV